MLMFMDGDEELRTGFYPASANYQGVTLAEAVVSKNKYRYEPSDFGAALAAMEAGAVDHLRVLVDAFLVRLFTDWNWDGKAEPEEWEWENGLRDTARALLRHILGGEGLGLLEESREGVEVLQARVRAQGWYAAAWRGRGRGRGGQ
jgi:hypothetical protein